MDKSSGLSRSFVWVLSSSSLSGPCGTSYISCSGAGNMLTSVLLVRQMWFPKYLQCAILSKLRLSLESLWFAFKNCLQGFIIPITWIFIIYLQIYLDECCVQLCLFRKLSLLCTWMSKKKIMQKHLYSYNRRTELASKCWVSISDLTFCQGDNY